MAIKQKEISTGEMVEIYENLKEIQQLTNVSYRKENYYNSVNRHKLQKQIDELKTAILTRLDM